MLVYPPNTAHHKALCVEEGGIPAIVAAMVRHSKHVEVQEAGCRALRTLCGRAGTSVCVCFCIEAG